MTIEEAYQTYGARTYIASQGETLPFIVRQIYASDSDQYVHILKVLNPRVNWIAVPAGTVIEYIDPTMITQRLY